MQAIDYFITKCGDTITFYVDKCANRMFYKIIEDNMYSSYSFYDGEELDTAKDLYYSLLLAFKNVTAAEQFLDKVVLYEKEKDPKDLQEHKSAPLFLGYTDF